MLELYAFQRTIEPMLKALENLRSARLQGVELYGSNRLLFEFYGFDQSGENSPRLERGRKLWLEIEAAPAKNARTDFASQLKLLDEKPNSNVRSVTKPLILFLRSHFMGGSVVDVECVDVDATAAARLYFSQERVIEIRIRSDGPQITAFAEAKAVSLKLVRLKTAKASSVQDDLKRRLLKLERTLEKVNEELSRKRDELWTQAGQWLLSAQTLQGAPVEVAGCLDIKQSFSWNLNHCFEKAKQLRSKISGTKKRRDEIETQIRELKSEMARIDSTAVLPSAAIEFESKRRDSNSNRERKTLLAQAQSRGRTFTIRSFQFFVGKSAADNLRLLRAARPWHLWLHLKDYPGSHGILQINKGDHVTDSDLHECAQCLLRTQFGDKASRHSGDKFDILVAECRYVRPIKGDHVGRVNYSNARTFVHQFVLRGYKRVDDSGL